MPITVSTDYSEKRMIHFAHFAASRRLLLWITMAVCNAIILICWVEMASIGAAYMLREEIGLILFCDLLILFTSFGLPYFTVKKHKGRNHAVHYVFEETQMQLTMQTHEVSENTTLLYSALHKAVRYKDELYLYINSRQAYLVDISAFDHEQEVLLRNALCSALTPKKVHWR